jgi:hypothetical protein
MDELPILSRAEFAKLSTKEQEEYLSKIEAEQEKRKAKIEENEASLEETRASIKWTELRIAQVKEVRRLMHSSPEIVERVKANIEIDSSGDFYDFVIDNAEEIFGHNLDYVAPVIFGSGSINAKKYESPPDIMSFTNESEYLDSLLGWAETIIDSAESDRDQLTMKYVRSDSQILSRPGQLLIARRVKRHVTILNQNLHGFRKPKRFALIERTLETWRRAEAAAAGNKGRHVSPHRHWIGIAVSSGCETFEQALDWLADIRRGCVFDIDHENLTIEVFPDEADKPYEVTFSAAKKAFDRARKALKK